MRGLNANPKTKWRTIKLEFSLSNAWIFIVQETMSHVWFKWKGKAFNCRLFQLWLEKKKCKKVFPRPGDEILMQQCAFHLILLNAIEKTSRFTDFWPTKRGEGLKGPEGMWAIIVFAVNENSWAATACGHQTRQLSLSLLILRPQSRVGVSVNESGNDWWPRRTEARDGK